MNIKNKILMPGIIFYGSMIYLSGQDILNLTSTFSEDNYRSETLKIDYDIGVDYYDIKNADKNVKISSSRESFINILSPKYIYLKKFKDNLGTELEYITDDKNHFLYFPKLKSASISHTGIVPIRDRFFTDYLTLIPDFYQDRYALSNIISLLKEAENTTYEIKNLNKNTCTLVIKQAMKPLNQKIFNEYTIKFIQRDAYWLPTELVHNYYLEREKSSIRLDGNFKLLYSDYEKHANVFLPKKIELWEYIPSGWIGNNDDGTPKLRKQKLKYYEVISLKNVSIEKENLQKGIIKIPDDVDIYAHSTKKQYRTADIDTIKKILKLSVETLPENSINAPR